MGVRGPVNYRTEELSRERDANRGGDRPDVKRGTLRPVVIPDAPEEWHPTAKRLYNALKESGQADFFQQSDWAFAYSVCEDVSTLKFYQLSSGKPHAESMKALYNALGNLMFTEADRRRLRVELMEEEDDTVTHGKTQVQQYEAQLRAVK